MQRSTKAADKLVSDRRRASSRRPFLGGVFSSLAPEPRWRHRVSAYIQREHARGRHLGEILQDGFVVGHTTAGERALLLEDPHLISRLRADCCASLRRYP